jgi:outer membrane protein
MPKARDNVRGLMFPILTTMMFTALFAADVPTPLTLEAAVHLAVTRNERVPLAMAQADMADAHLDKAQAQFFPSISSQGNYIRRAYRVTRSDNDGVALLQRHDALNGNLSLNMRLFDARSIPLYRAIKQEQQAARLEAKEAIRQLGFDAARAFLGVQSLEQVQKAAEERTHFSEQSYQFARGRYDAQLASSQDVTQAELELATARARLTDTKADVENAYLALGFLLNSDVQAPLEEPKGFLEAAANAGEKPPVFEALSADAQKRRPDLQASKHRSEQARLAAFEAPLRWAPTLDAIGMLSATNEPGFINHTYNGQIGVALNWLLFDGGARGADGREQHARYVSAQLQSDMLSRSISLQIKRALVDLTKAQAAYQQSKTASDVSIRYAQNALQLYHQGLAGVLQVTDASTRRFEAATALAQESYALANAYLNLNAALGTDALGEGTR